MKRHVIASMCGGLLIALGAATGPASAGEYQVWYSSSCCYQKIVRHETRTRYVPVYDGHYQVYPYYRPYRHLYADLWDVDDTRRFHRRYRYDGYAHYSKDLCYWRRTRGGAGWGRERVCY